MDGEGAWPHIRFHAVHHSTTWLCHSAPLEVVRWNRHEECQLSHSSAPLSDMQERSKGDSSLRQRSILLNRLARMMSAHLVRSKMELPLIQRQSSAIDSPAIETLSSASPKPATSRNSLKLHDTNRAVMLLYAQNFAVAWTLNGPSPSINTTAFFAQMDCFRIARYSPRTPKSKIPLAVFGE